MHHETTLNLPTLSSKDADRRWLAAMLAEAGAVQVIESPIVQRPLASGQWTAADMTVITTARREEQSKKQARRSGRPHGTTADDAHLVQRARAMADLGVARTTAARRLEIGCDRLDRICKNNNITFKKAE